MSKNWSFIWYLDVFSILQLVFLHEYQGTGGDQTGAWGEFSRLVFWVDWGRSDTMWYWYDTGIASIACFFLQFGQSMSIFVKFRGDIMEASAEGKLIATKVIARVYLGISGDIYIEIIIEYLGTYFYVSKHLNSQHTASGDEAFLNKFSRQNAAFGAEAFRTLQSSRASWRIRRTTWHPEQPEHAWTKFNRSTASSQWLRSLTGHHENDQNESPSSRLQWGCCGGYWRKFQLIFLCYIYFHIYISYIFILIWIWILFLYDFYTILCQLSHLRWGPLCPLWPKLSTSSRPPPRSWRIWCCRVLEQCQRSESFTALDHDRAATCCLTIPDYDFAILYNNIILCGWPCNHMQPYLSRMRWPWLIRSLQRSRRLPS